MRRHYSTIPFERYADDIIVHCRSEEQVRFIKSKIENRLLDCELEAHPGKTKIVYCKDSRRKGKYPNKSFDFLGYGFRPRFAKSRSNRYFVGFIPAVSDEAAQSIRETIRSLKIHLMSDKSIFDLSRMFNPVIRGWINYYGKYCKSALYSIFNQLNRALIKWAMRKYKRLKNRQRKAYHWLGRIARNLSNIFAHWRLGAQPSAGR